MNKKNINKANKSGITSNNARNLEHTKETYTCDFETNKEEKTMSTHVNDDEKEEENINARDDETVNERDDYFSIYQFGKTSAIQSINERS